MKFDRLVEGIARLQKVIKNVLDILNFRHLVTKQLTIVQELACIVYLWKEASNLRLEVICILREVCDEAVVDVHNVVQAVVED